MQKLASNIVRRYQGNMIRKFAGQYAIVPNPNGNGTRVVSYVPDEGEFERNSDSHYDLGGLHELRNKARKDVEEQTFSNDTYDRYKRFRELLKEREKDEDPAVSGMARKMHNDLVARWDIHWNNMANGILGLNDTAVPEYMKRRDEILALGDEYKKRHATPAWKRYTPWVGGGAALGGLAGAGIGHLAGKHTLLGALIGVGAGAGAGGLGRYLYDKYKDYSGEKRYKELISKPLV